VFTAVERAGGMALALDSGAAARDLARTWDQRAADLAHRQAPLTGVSEYPHLGEVLPSRRPAPAAPGGGLPRHRYAEQFEALRDRADAVPGGRPTVFLATLGPVAAHTARASFAANLFAAGGIATVSAGPVSDPVELAALFAASGARLACICGSDKSYAELAEPVAAALAPGAAQVWLAGQPADIPGVSRYVHTGVDAIATLTAALDLLAPAD
jgi:methylmalonyl-CoA mutase